MVVYLGNLLCITNSADDMVETCKSYAFCPYNGNYLTSSHKCMFNVLERLTCSTILWEETPRHEIHLT